MAEKPLIRVLCLPDLDRPIGGVKQLYRHVEHLISIGWDAAIITEISGFRPSWFSSNAPTLSLQESFDRGEINRNHLILLVPETYLDVDFSCFRTHDLSSIPRVIFNQNAYYSFGNSPGQTAAYLKQFYDNPLVLQVLSVSEDTHKFLTQCLGIPDSKKSRIVNSIEPIFVDNLLKSNRMHWMTRKNPQHVSAVIDGLQRSNPLFSEGWHGEPLQNLKHNQVAVQLNGARLFLSFGHPEGFGLPIAEAMASGCWVVGYSGGGGSELFRFGGSNEISFGDWSGFVSSVHHAFEQFSRFPRETYDRLNRQALAIRSLYSYEQERLSISIAWDRIADEFFQLNA